MVLHIFVNWSDMSVQPLHFNGVLQVDNGYTTPLQSSVSDIACVLLVASSLSKKRWLFILEISFGLFVLQLL
jgi:hypothetical protein